MPARAHRRSSRAPHTTPVEAPAARPAPPGARPSAPAPGVAPDLAPVVPPRRPRPLPVAAHHARRAVGPDASRETSAGGVVVRRVDGVAAAALIGRLDRAGRLRWSLPKGHVEPGETTEQTAVREVREETGITGRVTAPLGSLSYSFTAAGRRVHKRVHHYLMVAESGELSDADVEVSEVAWVPIQRLPTVLAYAAERRIARRAAELLTEIA